MILPDGHGSPATSGSKKNPRNGWSVRNTRIQHADRFDRFLLFLAMAYLLLAGLGLQAQLDFEPS
jgi:hypothetical protein